MEMPLTAASPIFRIGTQIPGTTIRQHADFLSPQPAG
ncbi:hypothetical protein CA51_29310 [Rosistilla oblonga]|nr:hypothetical protein CA51_29310 [Rosistilla oblonga]